MLSFKEFLSESRWVVKTNLQSKVSQIIKKAIIDMPSIEDDVIVDFDGPKDPDNMKVELTSSLKVKRVFKNLAKQISPEIEEVIRGIFKNQYPNIDVSYLNFKIEVNFDKLGVKGGMRPNMVNHEVIHVSLNIADTLPVIVRSIAEKKAGFRTNYSFRKDMIENVVDGWTRTIVHECIHVAQAIAVRVNNYKLYMSQFMPRRYTDPRMRGSAYTSDGRYLSMTQEIQAHAAATAAHLVKRMNTKRLVKAIQKYETWILRQNQIKKNVVKKDDFENLMSSIFGDGPTPAEIDFVKMKIKKAPKDVQDVINVMDDLKDYAGTYLLGNMDKKAIKRFVRDLKRTISDMTGETFS